MKCSNPFLFKNPKDNTIMKVPCRSCMCCRVDYQNQIVFGITKELEQLYKHGYGASFVTLTYRDSDVPVVVNNNNISYSLRRSDMQKLFKSMRMYLKRSSSIIPNFKYLYCGEYGDSFNRPHYHAIFLGLTDAQVKPLLVKYWKYGFCQIGSLQNGGVRYVSKYITKQLRGRDYNAIYDNLGIERPFLYHSSKLGFDWCNENIDNLQENNYSYYKQGNLIPLPSFYLKKLTKRVKYDPSDILRSSLLKAQSHSLAPDVSDYYASLNAEKQLVNQALEINHVPVKRDNLIYLGRLKNETESLRFVQQIIESVQ